MLDSIISDKDKLTITVDYLTYHFSLHAKFSLTNNISRIEYEIENIKVGSTEYVFEKNMHNRVLKVNFKGISIKMKIDPLYDYNDWTYISNVEEIELLRSCSEDYEIKIEEETNLLMVKRKESNVPE